MTTASLHLKVQRGRFAQHAVSAFVSHLPRGLRSLVGGSTPAFRFPTAAEEASLQAQEVREMAQSYAQTDPSFAADLFAAAARHEGLHAD